MLKIKNYLKTCFKLMLVVIIPYLTINLLLFLYTFGYYYVLYVQTSWVIFNNPNDEMAFYNRATVRSQFGDYKGAISDFTESIRVRSSNPKKLVRSASSYFQRAEEYNNIGEINLALADYRKAAKIYQKYNRMEEYYRMLNQIEQIEKKHSQSKRKNGGEH